jgi:hypothetical protein
MTQLSKFFRPAALAAALGVLALGAQAQTAAPATAASGPVERAVQGTKNVTNKAVEGTKKAGKATAKGARTAASAVRNTGEKIGEKVPAGSPDGKADQQGAAKEKTK